MASGGKLPKEPFQGRARCASQVGVPGPVEGRFRDGGDGRFREGIRD